MTCKNVIIQKKEKFITNPNLPKNNVSAVLLGSRGAKRLKNALAEHGIKVCTMASSSAVLESICDHTDILVTHLRENQMVFSNIEENSSIIDKMNICAVQSAGKLKYNYPGDILLNCTILGDKIFCNAQYTDKVILQFAENNNYTIINVKQGYAKCSICPVTANSIITDDIGICKAAQNNFIDALLVEKGAVDLYGLPYGFIGGTCGKISESLIAFSGLFKDDIIGYKIEDYLNAKGIRAVYLTNETLFDVGSIIPIKEYA